MVENGNLKVEIVATEGAERTAIDGGFAERCVTLPEGRTNVCLRGFTIRNGKVNSYAGGCRSGLLYDCVISNCWSSYSGGGVSGATLYNCKIVDNTGCCDGGGVAYSTLYNCVVVNNTVMYGGWVYAHGGGICESEAYNCTILGNYAWQNGGGAYDSRLYNCIVAGNSSSSKPNISGGVAQSCFEDYSINNVGFANDSATTNFLSSGSFNLRYGSPCINSGDNSFVKTDFDINGSERILDGVVDIGASEYFLKECIVTFDLCGASRIGGGELVQTVTNYCSAVAPLIRPERPNILFLGWSRSLDNILDDVTISAMFRTCSEETVVITGDIAETVEWDENKVYLIDGDVSVCNGAVLTIPSGTIVKFTPYSSLRVGLGGRCVCRGVVFTHVADDQFGGDTYCDGDASQPEEGAYQIGGGVEDDETTQYRFEAPLEVGGTLTGENRWPGFKTYKVKSSITLANGATLTVEPGAVVKFGSGMSLTVSSGATLNAQGTRSSPIVFTSIKDDEFGGDTNGDGESTLPFAGDWVRIYTSGNMNMTYCRIRYCNNNSDYGAIHGQGGKVTFDNGIIESSVYECVRMNSGTFVSHNSVFRDASMGFGYFGGSGTYVYNGVVADCTTGCRASNKHFYNTIFYRCPEFINSSGSSFDHCIFYNPPGFGNQSVAQVGKSGNVWANPCFVDAELGDYRIEGDSPCIDAGNGQVSSAVDYYNQPRQNIQGVSPTGTADANGKYPDIGLYEYQPRFAGSDVDLMVKSVTAPENLTVGGVVEISWRVANVGSADAAGTWEDRVELVAGDGTVVTLGTALAKGGIAAGGERVYSSTFSVPTISIGECKVRVTANYARDVYEGSQTANNVMLSVPNSLVSVPSAEISVGNRTSLQLIPGRSASYALDGIPAEGSAMILSLEPGARCDAFVSFGTLPTSYAHASAMTELPDGRILISIPPNAEGKTAYLSLVADQDVTSTGVLAELLEEYPAIYSVSKVTMPNIGKQSLAINGVGLDALAELSLVLGDKVIVGESLRVANAGEASATFDLAGAKAGDYSVVGVCEGGKEVSAPQKVSVALREGAKPKLEISLQAPTAIRANRWYEAIVTVKNKGEADGRIPVVILSGKGFEFKDPDGGHDVRKGVQQLLPMNPVGDPLFISPGEEIRLGVVYRSTLASSRNSLRYGLLDPEEAGWTSFISKGDLSDAEWEEALAEYSAGFDTPVDFLSTVYDRAAQFSVDGFHPVNAFRLYGIVQSEKNDERRTGLVSGIALDETGCPICNLTIGVGNLDDNDTVYVTTDANGMFSAYGVWPGGIGFTADDYNIVPEENVDLGNGGIAKARLTCTKITGEPIARKEYFSQYNRMSKLTADNSSFIWIDGFGRLLIGIPGDGDGARQLFGGAQSEYYRVISLGEDSAIVAAMVVHAEKKALRLAAVRRDANGLLYEVGNVEVSDSVLGLSSIKCENNTLTLVVRVKGEVQGASGFSILTYDIASIGDVKKSAFIANRLKAAGEEEKEGFVLDTSGLLNCDFKNFSISFNPRTDTGLQPEGCCKWHRESSWGVGAGVEIPISADGSWTVPISASGGQIKKSSYYCQRAMGAGSSCEDKDMMLTARSEKSSIEVEGGIKYTFPLNTEYLVRKLKGMGYKIMRNVPVNLNLEASGTLSGSKSHDLRERHVPKGNGSVSDFRTVDDNFHVQLEISGNATANIGLAQFEGGKGRGRKKRELSINTSGTEDVPLEAHGEITVEAHYDRNYRNGKLFHQDGGGSISGEVRVYSLKGTLSGTWDPQKGFYGEWKYNFFGKEGGGNTLKNALRATGMSVKALNSSTAAQLMFASEKVDNSLTLSTWGVQLDATGTKAVGGKEFVHNGNILRGLFFAEAIGQNENRITPDGHDVRWCSGIVEFGQVESIYYLACEPDFSGEPEDLLVSYSHTRLYRVDCINGVWCDPVAVVAGDDWSQGAVVLSDQRDGEVMVAFKSSNILHDVDGTGSEVLQVLFDNGNRNATMKIDTVAAIDGLSISSLVPYFIEGGRRIVYSIANDDKDDENVELGYNGANGTWEKVDHTASAKSGLRMVQNNVTAVMSSSAGSSAGGRATLKSTSACGSCVRNCHCHCNDGKKPGDGCGCEIHCKCKGLCGLGECKCWDNHHDMDQPQSADPNEMAGPEGKGNARCVRDGDWMNYTIYFENRAEATAAAQDIFVTLPKDSELDWTTFELGEIAFGENIDTGLSGKSKGECSYALPGTTWSVRTIVTHTDEAVKWHLRVIDPSTPDNYPEDVYAGFLPPNDSTGRGEGYLRYKVKVRSGATAGKIIGASAIIVFDDNPAIETDPAWSNTVSRLVAVSGNAGAGATIMVDPNWIKTNLGESATDAQVTEELNKTGENGIKVWANAALGLNPNDEGDKFLVDAPQNDDTDKVMVKTLKGALPESAWMSIKYRVDVDQDGSGSATPGTVAQDASEFGIDIGGETDPTGVYKVLAVFTDEDGTEIEAVPAANQIGILRKAAANKREIVPVPWTKFAAGAEDIAVSNLVKTAGLTAGDKLYVYDDSAKRYATWELQSDKTWKPVKTVKIVNGKLEVQTADSPEVATVKRGSGVWLERQDTSKPIALVGQYEAVGATTTVAGGTATVPSWNLIASPAISNWNLNAICEGVGVKDRIIVPTGKEPRIYTRDAGNAKWGYTVYEANDKGIVKPVRKEDDTLIAPGAGLWYISEGGAPVIKW